LSGHLHDDPHDGTRLGKARDVASQHPEGGSVQQAYVVRSDGGLAARTTVFFLGRRVGVDTEYVI